MKISLINNVKYRPQLNLPKRKTSFISKQECDSVSFSSIFQKKTKALSSEEMISEEIESCIYDTRNAIKILNKQAKEHLLIASEMFNIGKKNRYLSYIPYGNPKKCEKLIFDDFDKETKIPSSVTHILKKEGLSSVKPIKKYSLYPGNLLNVEVYYNEDYDVSILGNKKGLVCYRERNHKNGYTKEISSNKDYFTYFEGETDEEGKTTKTFREINFYERNIEDSLVIWTDKKTFDTKEYKYDIKDQMWKNI